MFLNIFILKVAVSGMTFYLALCAEVVIILKIISKDWKLSCLLKKKILD